jgi:hypothetical protein
MVSRTRLACEQFHESQAIAIHVDSPLTVILHPERQIDPQSEFQSSDSLAMHFNRSGMGGGWEPLSWID